MSLIKGNLSVPANAYIFKVFCLTEATTTLTIVTFSTMALGIKG
jgi:hypothetical protein